MTDVAGELIEVVLVDDQQLVRSGLRMILESEPDIVVVGEGGDGREGVRLARTLEPHVVLMDIQMPVMDGLAATEAIGELPDPPKVVVLTTFERDDYVFRALRQGASGFLLKNAPPAQLIDAVRVVAAGDSLLSPSVTRRLIQAFADTTVIGMTINHERLSDDEISAAIVEFQRRLSIPVTDALTRPVEDLVTMVVTAFPTLRPLVPAGTG